MPVAHSKSSHVWFAGFVLPAVVIIVSALLILAVGALLVVGLERNTSRSHVDHQRADLAARAALEAVTGILTVEAANDTFTLLQSTLKQPVKPGRERAPFLFLVQGDKSGGDGFTFRYVPLFSSTGPPADTVRLTPPAVEPLVGALPAQCVDLDALPYLDPAPIVWLPIVNAKNQIVARYAFWVEDLQGKIDPNTAGNIAGPGGTHAGVTWPFPAPGLNPSPEAPALDRIALHAIDPAATTEHSGELGKTLVKNRPILVTPDSTLAAAEIQPPLIRNTLDHLAHPQARAVEENLTTTVQPYFEQPRVPYLTGIDTAAVGEPKLNLNTLLAMGPAGVEPMAAMIRKALPAFASRQGGFPDDYLKTLAANAIDYADEDPQSTQVAGSHRGLDGFPLISEVVLQVHYMGQAQVGDRRILTWQFKLFAELWNMTQQDVSGQTRLSYEVALPMEGIGAGTSSQRFDAPELLENPAKATHQLTKIKDRFWSPEVQVALRANEFKFYEFAAVSYTLDVGPSSISVADHFSLTEHAGAAGVSLLWNGQEIDRASGIIRQKSGLEFDLSKPRHASKATVAALSLGPFGAEVDNPGDPRISYYLRSKPLGENAYPENSSPNRRNIRRRTIYDADAPRKPKTYGRVLPSEWPDGGHDSLVGTWPLSENDAVCPTDVRYQWAPPPIAAQAPQRLSNAGRFYSATELGRVYDPILWQPTYDIVQDTTAIRKGLMPASRYAWPDVLPASPASPDHGGGNSLRIGRPEHPAFDQPGKRALNLLDLFHVGQARSLERALREGKVVEIRGHVNINTATRDALRALAVGALGQDPSLASVPNTLNHDPAPVLAPATTPVTLYAPSAGALLEADRLADAILRARPFASPSELALVKDADGKYVLGNPDGYRPGIHIPNNTRVQWTDSAAEEVFARVHEAATVRSRNFRVWVIGQAVAPTATADAKPEVLAEVRKVFTVFADPGERTSEGTIDPAKFHPRIIHENTF
ncbi:MAG: hypothetical protein WCO57_05155 [Verrucomicrobiota bacterium]